jgi:hypothetical protein
MAPIKSAWEVALENTKDIEGNKETLAAGAARDEGRKLAAKALEDTSFGLKEALKSVARERIELVREGLIQSLLANLVLPLDEFALRKNKGVGAAVSAAVSDTRKVSAIFGQLENFFREYLEERKRMLEAIERQYAPRLKKKEEEMSRQMGQRVRINPAQDPEFQAMLRDYLAQLDLKYDQVLANAKEEIRQLFAKSPA